MNHPCPRYEPELSAYLDGETTPALRAEIESHLRVCDSCRAAVGQLRLVSRTLRRWDAQETRYATSTGFRNRVLASVGAGRSAPRTDTVWRIAAGFALVAAGAGGYALVAPRLADLDSSAPDRVSAQLAELKSLLAARPAPVAAPVERHSGSDVPRVAPLDPVVARLEPDDAPSAPPSAPDVFEPRGDEHFLRDALPDHDAYSRERRILALEEQLNRTPESPVATAGRPTSAQSAALSPLATFLGEVRVAAGNYPPFNQVQVWPIELDGAKPAARAADRVRAVPCADAIAQEILSVTESPVRETVVAVNNDPKRPVLVLAGDVLAGGRQDRVAREDLLIAPGERLSIPTYTSGRARSSSYRTFTSSRGVAPPDLRALIAVDRALMSGGLGQEAFDDAVGRTVGGLASPGRYGSLDNIYSSNPELAARADLYVKTFAKRLEPANVVGFAVSAGGNLLGVEVFGDHATFADHRVRVLRSYVMAALAPLRLEGATPSRESVAAILAAAPRGAFHAESQTLSGTFSVFRGVEGAAFGFGLLDGSRVVHSVFFTSVPAGAEPGGAPTGRRAAGDPTPPIDEGHGPVPPTRGDAGDGAGVAPK